MSFISTYRKLLAAILISFLLLLIHTWTSYINFHYPYIGIEVLPTPQNEWLITEFHINGIAEKIGLELHDEIISINNLPIVQHFTVYKFHSVEKLHTLEVIRNNDILTFNLQNEDTFSKRLLYTLVAEIFLFSLAVILSTRSNSSTSTKLLITFFIGMGLAFMCAEASAKSDIFSIIIVFASITLIPFLILHFLYQILKEKGQVFFSFNLIKLCYALVIPFCLMRFLYFLPGFTYQFYNIDRLIMLIFFVIGSLGCLLFLIFVYRKRRLEFSYSATIIKTVLFAFSICFIPYLLLTVIPDIIRMPIIDYSYGMWFIVLFPIIFFYLCYKRKLFQINQIWINNLVFSFTTVLWHRAYFSSIQHLLNSLHYIKAQSDFEHYFLRDICKLYNYSNAALLIIDQHGTNCWHTNPIDKQKVVEYIHNGEIIIDQFNIFSISREEHYQSYLVLEHRKQQKKVNKRTQTIVDTIRVPLALLIENLYLNQNLSKEITQMLDNEDGHVTNIIPSLKSTIFQLLEQEHKQMASDLHDTLLQDLLFARQRVLSLRNNIQATHAIDHQLADLAEYLQIINLGARDTIFQIYPHLLKETGFAIAVSNLIETERSHSEADIILSIEYAEEWNKLNFDDLLQIFRIIQELLSNARKHADAKQIKFLFTLDRTKHFVIHYVDDGVGIANYKHFEKTGWSGIQHRIQSMSADIVIDSTKQTGLSIKIIIPKLGVL